MADAFADSFTDTALPFGVIGPGSAIRSALEEAHDRDWFQVDLVAGLTYTFELAGIDTAAGTLSDPLMRLYDNAGANLAVNDDNGEFIPGSLINTIIHDSRIIFTPETSGTYYIEAMAYLDNKVGTYTLRTSATDPSLFTPNDDNVSLPFSGGTWFALNGNDVVFGTSGGDFVYGGAGIDSLRGGGGNDLLSGGLGNDRLFGDTGDDSLLGGLGNDALYGGNGTDRLYGGNGNDALFGGAGKDSFILDFKPNKSANKDAIKDFRVVDDTVNLDNAFFTKVGGNGWLKAGAFWTNKTGKAHDASDRVIYDKDSSVLYYDADGSGHGAAVAFATIGKNLALTHKDFFIL